MVKVQKPQPKSLSKTQKIEGVTKEKLKATKQKKLSKAAAASADVAEIKAKNAIKKPAVKKVKDVVNGKPEAIKEKTKVSKKPLVLAPPESPSPVAPKAKGGKRKLDAAALESPVVTTAPKTKGGKKRLVASVLESPVVTTAPKTKGVKKQLVASVLESPVVTTAPKTKGGKKQLVASVPASTVEVKAKPKGNKTKLAAVAPASPIAPAPKPKGGKNKLVLAAPATTTAAAPKAKGGKKVAAVAAPVDAKTPVESTKKVKNLAKDAPAVKSVVEQKPKKQAVIASKPEKKEKQTEIVKPAKKTEKSKVVKEVQKAAKKVPVKPVTKKVEKDAANKGKGKGNAKVSKNKKAAAQKKSKKELELDYELKPFDEDKFYEIVSTANVHKICDALKAQVTEEVKKQKATSIFSDYRYILQVCCYKIPSCPKRLVKLSLQNSLVGPNDDVAIIVTDLQRGARVDYEPTVQHYEDLFREAGVEQKLVVVPFNRLRNDMGTFEAKRKFLNSHDYFLCDGRISGQANAFLGQGTQKPRNVLHAVRLSKENELPKEISRALCRTAYRQLCKGDLTAIPVGNHEHSGQQLAENILTVIKQLQQQYPGGLANIRSMYLKIDMVGTSALPLYVSLCSPPADTPYVVGPSERRMLKLKKEANNVLSEFAMSKNVNFIKLTPEQVKNKADVRAKRLALKAAESNNDVEDQDAVVPAKKSRKETVLKTAVSKHDDEEAEEADDDEDDEDEEENEDEDEEENEDEDEEENEDDDDDEDDDDEDDDDEDDDEEEEE